MMSALLLVVLVPLAVVGAVCLGWMIADYWSPRERLIRWSRRQ